jgi:hypothetical protein
VIDHKGGRDFIVILNKKLKKEGKMKKISLFWVLGICVVLFLGPLGTLDLSGQEQSKNGEYCWRLKDEVPAPIKKSVNAWVGECNARLEILISELGKWDEATIEAKLPKIEEDFSKTYLRFPILENDERTLYGWKDVISELRMIIKKDPDVRLGAVEVEAILLPHSDRTQKDLRLNIITHLLLGSEDPGLRGCGIHRNLCQTDACQ